MPVRKNRLGTVDHTALKVNQTLIIALLVMAFLWELPWLVAFVGAVMLIGTLWPGAGLFKLVYTQFLRPAGLLKPEPRLEKAHPHLFAQGLGGLFLMLATLAFVANAVVTGWLLTAIVVFLASINLFVGFCLGCFVYYQLVRRGIDLNLPVWRGVE